MAQKEVIEEGKKKAPKDGSKHKLQVAVLLCDEPAEPTQEKHGGFDDILHKVLEPQLKRADETLELVVQGFDVVSKRAYPSYDYLKDVDCVIISGSFVADAHENRPWLVRLAGYIIYLHDVWPQIRIIGICFGLQVIARAFGARTGPMDAGWEIGATELKLTDEGRKIVSTPGKHEDSLTIQQIHSDEVKEVPEGFKLLASSQKCKIQMLAKWYDGPSPEYKHKAEQPPAPYSDIHLFGMQGHPEWHSDVIHPLIKEFHEDGKLSKEEADEFIKLAEKDDDAEIIARSIIRVMGVAHPATHEVMNS